MIFILDPSSAVSGTTVEPCERQRNTVGLTITRYKQYLPQRSKLK
jgi:hypothetical protein